MMAWNVSYIIFAMKDNITNGIIGNYTTILVKDIFTIGWKMAIFWTKMFHFFSFPKGEK